MTAFTLHLLPERFAICRLPLGAVVPESMWQQPFCSITKTRDELSLVCPEAAAPAYSVRETGWRALRVAGTLEFTLVGVLASLTRALADAEVSVFAVSTFDTDYLLVKEHALAAAIQALRQADHTVVE